MALIFTILQHKYAGPRSYGLRLAGHTEEAGNSPAALNLYATVHTPEPSQESCILELYDQLRPSLLIYLSRLGLAVHEAEDVIHDCFVRLFDHLSLNEKNRNLRGWIFRVAHNCAMDLFREGRKIQHPDDDTLNLLEMAVDFTNPEEHAIQNEEVQRVQSALERLTQQQRAAVMLRAEDLRYREIASVLGVSTKRVSELIQRALVRLAEGR
jgi:RNA polymerase sigma-70 factor, ECF subfamily